MNAEHLCDQVVEKLQSGRVTAAVAGLGYVGLPMALLCARKLERVVGIDTDAERVNSINAGRSYVGDVSDVQLRQAVDSGKLSATTDYGIVERCDVVVICVPTPLRKTGEPDLSFIVQSVDSVAQHLRRGMLVVLESTSYPGTTDELVCSRLERDGMRAGRDFFLAFSPERLNPGPAYPQYTIENVPKVVGGVTPACLRVACAFYGRIVREVVPVSSSRTAEMVKLLENTYRSVNIAMVNELAVMCRELGVDIWEVVEAAKTKPYGFQAFYPGPGLGGHCIPIDPFYLAWKARLHGLEPRFIDLAGRINADMPRYVVSLATDLLNEHGKPVRGSRIRILGVAYKPDVSDTRESPALLIMEMLTQKGAQVTYTDPHVPSLVLPTGPRAGREERQRLESIPLEDGSLQMCDLVVVVTDHSAFPWGWIARNARLVLDTRNALKDCPGEHIRRL